MVYVHRFRDASPRRQPRTTSPAWSTVPPARPLDGDVVVVVRAIEPDHAVTPLQLTLGRMNAEEASAASDKNLDVEKGSLIDIDSGSNRSSRRPSRACAPRH